MYLPIRITAVSAILLCLALPLPVGAETFHWVGQGVMHFTDNPASLPRGKHIRVQVREDIHTGKSPPGQP